MLLVCIRTLFSVNPISNECKVSKEVGIKKCATSTIGYKTSATNVIKYMRIPQSTKSSAS